MTTENSDARQIEGSADAGDSRTNNKPKTQKPVMKPPGEIDPAEYEDQNDNSDIGELKLPDTFGYSVSERNDLFQKGVDFEKNDKPEKALKCYLACIKGLKNKTRFVLLPECLKNIADIYQAKGEYENAIQFAQAEKLFYETALIETQEIQKKIEEITGNLNLDSNVPQDLNDLNIEALRAEEYEHLARLCLDKKQAELALEYAGKCAKLRQQVYGSNHVRTRETLDFFASLYAAVGKEQYTDSVKLLSDAMEGDVNTELNTGVPEVIMTNNGEPVSILRQRPVAGQKSDEAGTPEAEKEKKQVRFHESVDDSIRRKRKEEIVSVTITLVLLFVCFLILASLGVWLYCSMDRGRVCPAVVAQLKSWLMTIHYNVHRLTTSASPKTEYSR